MVDRVFTRVGALDNLAGGQSTFLVEMVETANILNNATAQSLVLLDEVGRGTSTFDGLSVAWSVVTPILESWENGDGPELEFYEAGTWGPPVAESFLARTGREWRRL